MAIPFLTKDMYRFRSRDGKTVIEGLTGEQAAALDEEDRKKFESSQAMTGLASATQDLQKLSTPQPRPTPVPTPQAAEPENVTMDQATKFGEDFGKSLAIMPALDPAPEKNRLIKAAMKYNLGSMYPTAAGLQAQTALEAKAKDLQSLSDAEQNSEIVKQAVGQFNEFAKQTKPGPEGSQIPKTYAELSEALANLKANIGPEAAKDPAIADLETRVNTLRDQEKRTAGGFGFATKTKIDERNAIISGINPYTESPITNEDEANQAWDMWEKTWATSTQLGTTDKYIKAAAKKTGATTTASQMAQTTPEIQGRKAVGSGLMQTAKTQQNKVAAANAAMIALPDKDENGLYKVDEITPQIATELAMAQARLISPTGQISENQVQELKQGTLDEKLARAAGFFGYSLPGTTQLNLANIEKMIKREGALAQKQSETIAQGKQIEFTDGKKPNRIVYVRDASGKLVRATGK